MLTEEKKEPKIHLLIIRVQVRHRAINLLKVIQQESDAEFAVGVDEIDALFVVELVVVGNTILQRLTIADGLIKHILLQNGFGKAVPILVVLEDGPIVIHVVAMDINNKIIIQALIFFKKGF